MLDSTFYTWLLLPALIFISRLADVSLGTIRVIFISKGMKYLAAIIGFFEILIWLLAIGQIMQNLSNPVCYLAYAGGFAIGNFVGIWIAEKLSLGMVLVRVVTSKDGVNLVEQLKLGKYGVTSFDAYGATGQVKIIFTIVPRKKVSSVVDLIKMFNPKAFYSIEEVGLVEKGIFPTKQNWRSDGIKSIFKPFRKGK